MKATSFAFAMLAAGATAYDDISFMLNDNPGQLNPEPEESQSIFKTSKLFNNSLWNCSTCTLAMGTADHMIRSDWFQSGATSVAVWGCVVVGFRGGEELCNQVVTQFQPTITEVLAGHIIGRDRICNETLGLCAHPKIKELDLHDIVDGILATKPVSLDSDDYVNRMYAEIAADQNEREIIKAVHISDVHLDMEYTAGTNAQCDSFLCCRAEYGPPGPDQQAAGEWGSNAGLCDIPAKTFKSLMDFVVSDIKPDMLFWTGDNSSHNVWSNTETEITRYTEAVTNIIKDSTVGADITIVPILGNHDTWPVNVQDFSKPNSNYPINQMKEMWSDWLDEDAQKKFGEYGYYSQELKLLNGKALPSGSRVIAYNTNTCDQLNMYVWGERHDPGNQFAWLEQQLAEIEAEGGLAIMIGHYTPYTCQHEWGTRYRALMERFQNVVRFGLVGHTHLETYQLHNSMTNPEKPLVMTSVGGSVTSYDFQNPSFMVFDLDAKTLLPVNMHTYYIDLDEANEAGYPNWSELHDYKNDYAMTDLSPSGFKDLAVRIFTDSELAMEFRKNENRQNKNKHYTINQLHMYCYLTSAEQHERYSCYKNGGHAAYGNDLDILGSGTWGKALTDRIISNWINYSLGSESE